MRTWNLSPTAVGNVFEDFDRLVAGFVRSADIVQPSWNVRETDSHFVASFDLPGVRKDDIKIEVQNNRLSISGERQTYGKFARAFVLPPSVDSEKIEANYEDGVLTVALAKAEKAKSRTIEIKAERSGFFNKLIGPKKDEKAS